MLAGPSNDRIDDTHLLPARRRVLGGGGCDFCRMLAGRVYPRDNADFEAHGKCACTSEPVYGS